MLLEVEGLDVVYGRTHAVKTMSLGVGDDEIVTVGDGVEGVDEPPPPPPPHDAIKIIENKIPIKFLFFIKIPHKYMQLKDLLFTCSSLSYFSYFCGQSIAKLEVKIQQPMILR